MEVNGGKGFVSMVVQSYVEEGVHRRMEVVVAKRVDQILVALAIFDCPILDPSSHCNLLYLQHDCNQTHSQRG